MEKGINKAVSGVLDWGLLSRSRVSNPQIHTVRKTIDVLFYTSWIAKVAIGGEPLQSIALAASAFWYAAFLIEVSKLRYSDD